MFVIDQSGVQPHGPVHLRTNQKLHCHRASLPAEMLLHRKSRHIDCRCHARWRCTELTAPEMRKSLRILQHKLSMRSAKLESRDSNFSCRHRTLCCKNERPWWPDGLLTVVSTPGDLWAASHLPTATCGASSGPSACASLINTVTSCKLSISFSIIRCRHFVLRKLRHRRPRRSTEGDTKECAVGASACRIMRVTASRSFTIGVFPTISRS